MKVRVTFTIDVDKKAWAQEYGLDLEDVREDVQNHIRDIATEHVAGLGLLTGQD